MLALHLLRDWAHPFYICTWTGLTPPTLLRDLASFQAGTGGRELVFQMGPGNAWLSRIYARAAPRPNANGLAQACRRTDE